MFKDTINVNQMKDVVIIIREKIPLLSCHKSGDFCFSIITKEFVKITVTTFLILFTLIVTLNIIVD